MKKFRIVYNGNLKEGYFKSPFEALKSLFDITTVKELNKSKIIIKQI